MDKGTILQKIFSEQEKAELEFMLQQKMKEYKKLLEMEKKKARAVLENLSAGSNHPADANIFTDTFSSRMMNIINSIRGCDDAIKRLEKGEYGLCEDCEKPISMRRLKIIPFAKYCVKCGEESEKVRY